MFVPRSVKRKKGTGDTPCSTSTGQAPNIQPHGHVTRPLMNNVVDNILNDLVNRTVANLVAMQTGRQTAMVPTAARSLHQQLPSHSSSSEPAYGQSISVAQLFAAARNETRNHACMMNVGALCSSGSVPVYNRSGTNRPSTSQIKPDRCYDNVGWIPNQTRRDKESDGARHIGRFCPPRQWEFTEIGQQYEQRPSQHHGLDFTVMSYNVLAQDLLEDNMRLYNHCSRDVLSWRHRREHLLQEIKHLNPDILCLQEVNTNHYHDFFKPKLLRLGYASDFYKRTGNKLDGCATFYKTAKFTLEESQKVPYYHPKGSNVLDRDNIALILKLRPLSNRVPASRRLCISNTHLLFNPRRGDVKLAQLMVLLAELDKMAYIKDNAELEQLYHGIIMCGDFNSEPHSDMYKLLTMGCLEYEGLAIRAISGQGDLRPGRETYLTQNFFPQEVGINDNCQYCDVVRNRKAGATGKSATSLNSDTCDKKSTSYGVKQDQSSSSSDSSGRKTQSHGNQSSIKSDDVEMVSLQSTGLLQHQLKLVSTYRHTLSRLWDRHDEVTTHHGHASCTVDYIFYGVKSGLVRFADGRVKFKDVQEGCLSLLGRYGLMADHELRRMGSLPNMHLGSDHLSIMTRFLLG